METGVFEELFTEQLENKKKVERQYDRSFLGQILVVEIDSTLLDGASESCTSGFIDENDYPPIDTWFYLTEGNIGRILYAWIPQRFISIVQIGIDVNATELFKWEADWIDAPNPPVEKPAYHKPNYSLKRMIGENTSWITPVIVILILILLFLFQKYIK